MKIKITAETLEDFKVIEDHLKNLPDTITCQVEKAEYGVIGFIYTIKKRNVDQPIVYVPNNVKQIKTFDNEIIIYCDGYIMRITENMMKDKLHYAFVPPNRNTV